MKKHQINPNILYCCAAVAMAAVALPASSSSPQTIYRLVCAAASGGAEIRPGALVKDAHGQTVGWVSVSQCAAGEKDDKLRVRLDFSPDWRIAEVSLKGVTVNSDGSVTLPMSADEFARPPAPDATAPTTQAS